MNRTLTVVQLLPALHSGGVEKGTLEVADALVKSGHRSIVISAGGQLVEPLRQQGSEHICWDLGRKSLFTLLQIPKLRQWLSNNPADILHVRSRMPAWVTYLAWNRMPAQHRPHFVTTVHGLNSVSRYSKIMTTGERVIAVSDTVKDYVSQHYPDVDSRKIRVIHRGIDAGEFPFGYRAGQEWQQQWYAQFPQTRAKWLLCLPGRLTRLKGHEDFLNIVAQLTHTIPEVHGLIVGAEDPKRQTYARQIHDKVDSMGLQEHITFTDYRTDMKQIFSLADVILSLSNKPESFGRTAVEAISLGRPVFGYHHGGVGETLNKLYPQGLIKNGDTMALAQRCEQLYRQQILPPQQPQNLYLKSVMLEQTLQLYNELAGQNLDEL